MSGLSKEDNKPSKQTTKMIMTRSMTAMRDGGLCFSHPALANVPAVKFVIAFNGGFEGYLSFEDAYGDYAFQKHKHGKCWLLKAAKVEELVATGRVKKQRK